MKHEVKAIPEGFHSVTPSLIVRRAKDAIEFYKKVFGAKLTCMHEKPDGKVMHATIEIGDSILMLADECPPHEGHEKECVRSPEGLKGTTINLYLYVNNADEIFNKAIKNGAVVSMPIDDMFWGDRMGVFKDPFGHSWSVATHVKDVSKDEMENAMKEYCGKEK